MKNVLPISLFSAFILTLSSLSNGAEQEATAKIIGGDDVQADIPWMAGLHGYLPQRGEFFVFPFCGGTLIAPGWVLTAAHCITDERTGADPALYNQKPDNTLLRLNDRNLDNEPLHEVASIVVHPEYGFETRLGEQVENDFNNDIALIRLRNKVSLPTLGIAEESLMARLENSSLVDDIIRIMGWGIVDDADFDPDNAVASNQPRILQTARLDYLTQDRAECRFSFRNVTVTDTMICGWETEADAETQPFGQDICAGDSGGPFLLNDGTELSDGTVRGDWLLGAASFGPENCSAPAPSVYTRVPSYVPWIEATSAAAADPLIDVTLATDLPAIVSADDFLFEVEIKNNSSSNPSNSIDVTADRPGRFTNVRLLNGNADCRRGRFLCAMDAPLAAGNSERLLLSADWGGGLDRPIPIDFLLQNVTPDDYRPANNTIRHTVTFTRKSELSLRPWRIVAIEGGIARLEIDIANDPLLNTARNTVLSLSVPTALDVTAIDTRCSASSDTPGAWSCALGELDKGRIDSVALTVSGTGSFDLQASASNSNGDVSTGDTSQQTTLELSLLPDPALRPWQQTAVNADGTTLSIQADNLSLWNSAENTRLNLTLPSGLTVVSIDSRCQDQDNGLWQCQLGTLAAEAETTLTLTLSGTGNFTVQATLAADNGDNTPGDSSETIQLAVTELPDPFLGNWQITAQQNEQAIVRLPFGNRSPWHNAEQTVIQLSLAAELLVTDIDSRCTSSAPGSWQCDIGSLGSNSNDSLSLALQGVGNFAVEATLSNNNGDDQPGDRDNTLALTLLATPENSSSGGGAFWWWLPALALYRLRKLRSQSRQ